MYAGTTFYNASGNVAGAHQRIDRIAKKHLIRHIGRSPFFPSIRTILHFEGKNGPDGIKSKSPSIDEPWHFINPEAGMDDPLIEVLRSHMNNLTKALKEKDEVRAGFEAAWLAHAIVDGLTPAHHYPLAEKVEELWGKPHNERSSRKDKIMIKGVNYRDTVSKNWQYWGTGGVFTAHYMYELGFASSITMAKFGDINISDEDFAAVKSGGYLDYFLKSVKDVDNMGTYQEFMRVGWSAHLGRVARKDLAPLIIKNVCLAWYAAVCEAK